MKQLYLIITQNAQALSFVVCENKDSTRVLWEDCYQYFDENAIENILLSVKHQLQEQGITIPQNVYLFIEEESLIIKKWELPFRSKAQSLKALKHLLKRDIPVEEEKIQHVFFFQNKLKNQNRIIFSYSMLKRHIEQWKQAFLKAEISLCALSFVPFLFLEKVKDKDALYVYQGENSYFIAMKRQGQWQEMKIIPQNSLPFQDTCKALEYCFEDICSLSQQSKIYYFTFVADRKTITSSLKEKYNVEVLNVSLREKKRLQSSKVSDAISVFIEKMKNVQILRKKQPYSFGKDGLVKKDVVGGQGESASFYEMSAMVPTTTSATTLAMMSVLPILIDRIESMEKRQGIFSFASAIVPRFLQIKTAQNAKDASLCKRWVFPISLCFIALSVYYCFLYGQTQEYKREAKFYADQKMYLFKKAVPEMKRNLSMREMRSILKARATENTFDESHFRALGMLDLISNLSQDTMALELDEFNYQSKVLLMSGNIATFNHLEQYIDLLKKQNGIDAVDIISALPRLQKHKDGKEVIDFQLRLGLTE